MAWSERRGAEASWLAAAGGVLAAVAIGLAAYAAHGVSDAQAQVRLHDAALYGFVHGGVLAALGLLALRPWARWGSWLVLLGTLLFSGSLAAAALWHASTALAPVGGTVMMLGWLLFAVGVVRR